MFTKQDVVNIAFHIYVPAGTGLYHIRASTWMNPLINDEEAIKLIGREGNSSPQASLPVYCSLRK